MYTAYSRTLKATIRAAAFLADIPAFRSAQ